MESQIIDEVLDARMAEIAARDQLVSGLRKLNLGSRATRLFCIEELDYSPPEARIVLGDLGLIVTTESLTSPDPLIRARIESLKEWRRHRANQARVPAYRVISNRTLLGIASRSIASVNDLRSVIGFGPKKALEYGFEIIELLCRH